MLDISKLSKEELLSHMEAAGITPAALDERMYLVWSIDDVLKDDIRPDLTPDQAMEVLCAVKNKHDSTIGVTWDTILCHADTLFPN